MMPGRTAHMKQHIEHFMKYLLYERNASPATIRSYRNDLNLLREFLTPPGEKTMPLGEVDHRIIREFASWLYDRKQQKASVARKLAALRTFFKFCVREKITKQNPARLISTPKIPKRVPRVLTAEELNRFLDGLPGGSAAGNKHAEKAKQPMTRFSFHAATAPFWNCCMPRAFASANSSVLLSETWIARAKCFAC